MFFGNVSGIISEMLAVIVFGNVDGYVSEYIRRCYPGLLTINGQSPVGVTSSWYVPVFV